MGTQYIGFYLPRNWDFSPEGCGIGEAKASVPCSPRSRDFTPVSRSTGEAEASAPYL